MAKEIAIGRTGERYERGDFGMAACALVLRNFLSLAPTSSNGFEAIVVVLTGSRRRCDDVWCLLGGSFVDAPQMLYNEHTVCSTTGSHFDVQISFAYDCCWARGGRGDDS